MPVDRNGPQSASSTSPSVPAHSLSERALLGAPPVRERADAARNRLKILSAAESLFAERGVAFVTMDDIAAEAGVGKGTLYRRFTDKGELAAALLSERGRHLQEQLLRGEPPLGPGAEPVERLVAFTETYLAFQARHLDLVLLSETSTPGARLRKGSYTFWRQHCASLLQRAGAEDPVTWSEVLLAGLSAEQVQHWIREEGRTVGDLAVSLGCLARSLCAPRG